MSTNAQRKKDAKRKGREKKRSQLRQQHKAQQANMKTGFEETVSKMYRNRAAIHAAELHKMIIKETTEEQAMKYREMISVEMIEETRAYLYQITPEKKFDEDFVSLSRLLMTHAIYNPAEALESNLRILHDCQTEEQLVAMQVCIELMGASDELHSYFTHSCREIYKSICQGSLMQVDDEIMNNIKRTRFGQPNDQPEDPSRLGFKRRIESPV